MTYHNRILEKGIYTSFSTSYITAILGPRRVGKSTLVEEYVHKHPKEQWVLLNMDRLSERQRIEQKGLRSLIEEYSLQIIGKKKYGSLLMKRRSAPRYLIR